MQIKQNWLVFILMFLLMCIMLESQGRIDYQYKMDKQFSDLKQLDQSLLVALVNQE